MKVFKVDTRNTTVREVECETPGYPNKDVEGDVMYENTHFATAGEAWDRLESCCKAAVNLAGVHLAEIRAEEVTLTRDLANKTLSLLKAVEGRVEFERNREKKS